MIARIRDLNYEKQYLVELHQTKYSYNPKDPDEPKQVLETKVFNKIVLCSLPVMVRSKNCALHGLS